MKCMIVRDFMRGCVGYTQLCEGSVYLTPCGWDYVSVEFVLID